MLNVAYARPPTPGKGALKAGHTAAPASPAGSTTSSADSRRPRKQPQSPPASPPQQPQQQRQRAAATAGNKRDQHPARQHSNSHCNGQEQQTNLEKYELRQLQLLQKREEVTWETSIYDRERGRMVRSLNVVERNRLLETQRQLSREMEQRIRDIRQEQTAVLLVRSAGLRSSGTMGNGSIGKRAWSYQDLRTLLSGGGSSASRSHSGGTSRIR